MQKTCSFIFVSVLIISGCTGEKISDIHNVSDIRNVIVTPSTLNFGQVRVVDSPLSLSFDIENTSDKPLSILDITSGCGCTVIDIPQEPILPKERKSFAVKVDLYGRSGEFLNIVRIETASHDSLFVDIRGTIVTDIWFSGQSIRCTAEPGQSEAKTVFSLFTQDYPDVQFDWSDLPPEIEIQEISRSVSDGICNIQFALSVSVRDKNSLSHQLMIVPKEESIAPLIVPIYCYRNEKDQQRVAFSTKQISLGILPRNVRKVIRIYGNPDVIHAVCEIAWKDIPSGVTMEIIQHDSNVTDILEVALTFTDTFPSGFFEGKILLKTVAGQEFSLSINGEVSESEVVQNVSGNLCP